MAYNLTPSQQAILRFLVKHVETDGRDGDDVWITPLPNGRTIIEDFEGDSPDIPKNVLDIFVKNGLMFYQNRTPGQYICTLTDKAYKAVDSDFSAAKQNQSQIFLAYASEDRKAVIEVYQRLEAEGFKPWMDKEDLLPGQNWEREIPKTLRTSDFALVFLSETSVTKRGYVQKEFKLVLDVLEEMPEGQIFVIPVKLDDCKVPEMFGSLHWANFYEEDGFEKVVKSIQAHTEEPVQRKETIEERAVRLKRDRDAEAERQRFLESEKGVQAACEEAEKLYQEFDRLAKLIRDKGWPMHMVTDRHQGSEHRYKITSLPYRLVIHWYCHFNNSLSRSFLYVTLRKEREDIRYEEKFDKLREHRYQFDVLKTGEQGWQQTEGGSEFYRTEDLAEMTMHDLLDRIDEEKAGSH